MEDLIQRVAKAAAQHKVVGPVTDTCVYRVMAGVVALGGDYGNRGLAQAACDLLNARAAIEETLRVIRDPGEAVVEAGAFEAMPSDYWAATIIEQSRIAAVAHWQAMIDQLLQSLPGQSHDR